MFPAYLLLDLYNSCAILSPSGLKDHMQIVCERYAVVALFYQYGEGNCMYKNTGEKILTMANVFTGISIVASIILGIVTGVLFGQLSGAGLGFLIGAENSIGIYLALGILAMV